MRKTAAGGPTIDGRLAALMRRRSPRRPIAGVRA